MSALCAKPAPPVLLDRATIEFKLKSRPLWELGGYKNDGSKLKRVFVAQNVKAAHEFMSKVGELSEQMRHHPDIYISTRGNVEVTTYTHDVGGVTERDFDLADEIDRLPVRYSEMWRTENADRLWDFKTEQQARMNYHAHHPCTNKKCMCPHCTCGEACSCGVSPDVVCDPCVEFKSPKDAHSSTKHNPEHVVAFGRSMSGKTMHPDHDNHPMHAHSFHVDTAHHTAAGHGDGVDRLKDIHSHDGENTMAHKGDAGFPSDHDEDEAWLQMVQGLAALKNRGYDISVADSLLPMLESRRIYRDWISDMRHAYVHIKHRIDPAWAKTEPAAVVDACKKFVHGYDVISHIYLGLAFPEGSSK